MAVGLGVRIVVAAAAVVLIVVVVVVVVVVVNVVVVVVVVVVGIIVFDVGGWRAYCTCLLHDHGWWALCIYKCRPKDMICYMCV